MSNLAETILRDVPIRGRIYTGGRINTGGNCLDELVLKKDVEAALTAAMDPALTERAGEVLPDLQRAADDGDIDCKEAVSLIPALLTQNAAMRANTVQALDEADREYSRKTNDLIERHAEQLAALRAELDKWMERCGRERAFASSHRIRAEAAEAEAATLRAKVARLEGAADRVRAASAIEHARASQFAAEAKVARLEGAAKEYRAAVLAFDGQGDLVPKIERVNAAAAALDALTDVAADGTAQTEYERKVAQMKKDFPNGI